MVSALNFKPMDRGALRGFFDLRYHGLTIKGCRLMDGSNGRWVALPQIKTEVGGETKWFDQMFLSPLEMEHVRKLAIADLESQGHIKGQGDQGQRFRKRRTNPEDEDLAEYGPRHADDGMPF